MQDRLLGIGELVAVSWLAAILLALVDRARPRSRGRLPVFDPEHHVGLGIYARLNPQAPLPRWKWVLAVPLFLLVSPVYLVILAVFLPIVLWRAVAWCWARVRG